MAAGDQAARRKARPMDYSKLGERGRKTGTEVVQATEQDEYGMEPVNHFFPPTPGTTLKPSATASASATRSKQSYSDDSTDSISDAMEIAESMLRSYEASVFAHDSSGPDVEATLSSKTSRLSKLPPKASPFKPSGISGTPQRRSLGPRSSPTRVSGANQGRPLSPLDFSMGSTRSTARSIDRSPGRPSSAQRPNGFITPTTKFPHRTLSPPSSPEPEQGRNHAGNMPDDATQTDIQFAYGDDSLAMNGDMDVEESEMATITTRKSTRVSDISNASRDTHERSGNLQATLPKKRGRPARNSNVNGIQDGEEAGPSKRPRRSIETADAAPETQEDDPIGFGDDEDELPEPEAADGEFGEEEVEEEGGDDDDVVGDVVEPDQAEESQQEEQVNGVDHDQQTQQKPRRGRPPGSKSKTKQQKTSKTTKDATASKKPTYPRGPGPHSNVRTRHQTPMDEGVEYTRSGRMTYQPLAFWRGEHAITKPHEPFTTEEIIRKEVITPVKRSYNRNGDAKKSRRKKRQRATVYESDSESGLDPDDAPEEWEVSPGRGLIEAMVNLWDPTLPVTELETSKQDVAYSAEHVQPNEANQGARFRFAKTLQLPFFGTGMVEVPPEGFKRAKNSRKMQMAFFVHFGKVEVEVAGAKFSISKGGMWIVPRGNFYSIENKTRKDARIFFAQGCEIESEEVEDDQPERAETAAAA